MGSNPTAKISFFFCSGHLVVKDAALTRRSHWFDSSLEHKGKLKGPFDSGVRGEHCLAREIQAKNRSSRKV